LFFPGCGLLLAAKELGEETGFSFVALAALVLGDAAHDLVHVLTTTGPGGFAALTASDFSTHKVTPNVCIKYTPGGIAHDTLDS
jgi:hypothetical protein